MDTQTAPNPLIAILSIPWAMLRAASRFLRRLRSNVPGMIGFIGLVAYFIFTFIMPRFIEFDNDPNLDEIVGPIGSRIQLAVHQDNAHLVTFEDLAGKTVGVVDQTGGLDLIAPYADTLTIEKYRWTSRRAGAGLEASLIDLANREIDALLVFSKTVTEFVSNQEDPELKALFN